MTTFDSKAAEPYLRTACSACGCENPYPVLNLGYSPIADAYTAEPVAQPTYPLELARCSGCTLVQLRHALPQEVLFGAGYSFYSSASAPLSRYHEAYAADILKAHPDLDPKVHVVEIGCNDGDLSRHLIKAGFGVIGIDPASGPAQVACDRGVSTIFEPFTRELALALRDDHGPAQLVIANHVLAHVADVSDMLGGIRELLADDGTAYVEVQYLPDLLLGNAFDLVYHEHRSFFSLYALARAAWEHDLHIGSAQLTERQGGSLRVTLSRSHHRATPATERLFHQEAWLRDPQALRGMQGRADRLRDRLRDLLDQLHAGGAQVAGYGAPAKATTLMSFCGVDLGDIPFVTDTTPAKQWRYIPNSGIQVIPPAQALDTRVDVFLLLAWNYLPQILRQEADFTAHGGRWLVPIPAPTII